MVSRVGMVFLVFSLLIGCTPADTGSPTPTSSPSTATPSPAAPTATPPAGTTGDPASGPTEVRLPSSTPAPPAQTEILWDRWGVPHIYAKNEAEMAYAFGWAQMHSHGTLLLRLYARARGRASEYFGPDFIKDDKEIRTYGIPDLAAQWYEEQSDLQRELLDQFAAGINDYAKHHPEAIPDHVAAVLPVKGADLLAHTLRTIHFTFVSNPEYQIERWLWPQPAEPVQPTNETEPEDQAEPAQPEGSNGWVVNSTFSASDAPMLLGNPHLPWSDRYLFYEFHIGAPVANEFYGATLVGLPAPLLGFNNNLGWTLTVNTYDGSDLYELTLADDGEGYLFDGEIRPFETHDQTFMVKQPDGTLRQELHLVRHSVHGPVVAEKDGNALALRVAGLDRPGMLEQWWDMSKATSLETFETVLRRLQFPMSNILYTDREDTTMLLFNGLIPVRSQGDWAFWKGIVPGDTSETLWTEYHPYEDLPRVANPESGWLGSSNEPPWYMTIPYPLNPDDFPPYFSPPEADPWNFRWQYARRLLAEQSAITFDELLEAKFSSHSELADRVLDDLIATARAASGEQVQQAATILAAWDRAYTANSHGALLFSNWARIYKRLADQPFAEPWANDAPPLTVPRGVGDPQAAVSALREAYDETWMTAGSPDVAWGDVIRMVVGEHNLPASGGSSEETVRVLEAVALPDGTYRVVFGDSFIFAVEFSRPRRASVLLVYGNATQPGSPHIGDQLEYYARNEMRTAWLERSEIEANLEMREIVVPGEGE